jgi:hypothetical protein
VTAWIGARTTPYALLEERPEGREEPANDSVAEPDRE